MARVSQEHLDARRRQIIVGARRCFARNGFHATSMQDVLKEVGLSAGAVYRYFSGKEELIEAIVQEAFEGIRDAFAEAAELRPPLLPDEFLSHVLRRVLDGPGEGDEQAFAELVLQVWAETLRNGELSANLRAGVVGMRALWSEVVRMYQAEGLMSRDVDPDHVARTMMAMAMGFLAQQALFGDVKLEQLEDGLRAIMRMEVPDPSLPGAS
ncbi:TetR/AcrR family transcriptional regulator [Streptomyces sp. NPDC050418]|uniref:TetR/AcrR family transcriptional regulator n=1 Tax=Streptomyces sp. NPDC050418 TaxID=3365612 RepID=UPI0037A3BF10